MQTITKPLPPILRWAGGKRKHTWLFDAIAKVFNPHKHRLVEPFVGGIAIALGVEPKWALLNDANPYLTRLYQYVKDGSLTQDPTKSNKLDAEEYYLRRSIFNKGDISSLDRAWLFYYLNRTGYNGLCRFNQSGGYNNPYGKLANPKLDHDFNLYRDRFQNWEFTSMDFEQMQIFSNDVVVADPPYDVLEGKQDHDYITGGFSWDDQVRLANWLASLNVPAIACNLATDRIVNLYTDLGFQIEYVNAPRAIACNGDRNKVTEILAFKNI